MAASVLASLVVLFSVAVGALVWKLTGASSRARFSSLYAALGGLALGALSQWVEALVLRVTGLAFDVRTAGVAGALMAVFLLAAPLEEGAKVLVIWPLYRSHRIDSGRLGACLAGCAGAGFAASECGWLVYTAGGTPISFVRSLLGALAHVFFSAAWGYSLGVGRIQGRWFSLTWVIAVLLHALYDHIVWGRGPGYLAAVVPMLAFMVVGAWAALRDSGPSRDRPSLGLEPPTLREVRLALRPAEKPVMLHWVGLGALVTLGLLITLTAVSVFIGRRMGIDFALADEADVRSAGPLVLLGTGVLLAFPFAGYLIARASCTHTVLEPALATLAALITLIALFAVTAPVAVLFALALAPIALGLACGGAWIGIER